MAKEIIFTIPIDADKLRRGRNSIAKLQTHLRELQGEILGIDVEALNKRTKDLLHKSRQLSTDMKKTLTESIKAIVCPAEKYESLECDGMTRVLAYLLTQAGIEFITYEGRLQTAQQEVLHYWIEIPYQSGKATKYLTVDLRARTWLSHGMKDDDIPHGVFKQDQYPDVSYIPKATVNMTPGKALYNVLTR